MKKNIKKDIDLSSFLKKVLRQKERIKNFFWRIGENAFPTILILFFLSFFLGGIVFYQYSFQEKEDETVEFPLKFREDNYEKILRVWEEKEKRFEETGEKKYQSPFREEEIDEPDEREESRVITHVIEREDNLWNLATKYLGTGFRWKEITDEEGDHFPDWRAEVLKVGEKVLIPIN